MGLREFFQNASFAVKLGCQGILADAGPFFKEEDYPNLKGQTWIITGATGGIGLETAKVFAQLNANLWIVGRNQEKLDAAVATLKGVKSDTNVNYLIIDYNDLSTVKPGVRKFEESGEPLHGVIHNAGVMNVPAGSITVQGYEQTIGVNNLATQLLQDLLDPHILATHGSRIVWLSSHMHAIAPRNGFDLSQFEGKPKASPTAYYAASKALDYIQAVQWSLKHNNADTKSIAVHPGVIKSDLTRTSPSWQKPLSIFFSDTRFGALPVIFAALSPDAGNNWYVIPYGKEGMIRPDIAEAAHGKEGAKAMEWIEAQIASFR